ncbi:MAG: YdeI/OmpD-associated family protein [Marinirhabdus sp.]|nr:YdeI/OmpD-associated family protein [Marinirhabdus sp.]
MTASEKVTQYIKKHPKWTSQLNDIREVLNNSALTEAVKWGAPSYLLDKKIVIGMAAFKNHMGLWFHQGVFLKDDHNMLLNAQEDKTKALRQWRFEEGDTVNKDLVRTYVEEAIANCKAGKEIKPSRTKKVPPAPKLLANQFEAQPKLKTSFDALTPGKQREYVEYIVSAKREATKESRLEKIIPMILRGEGLNDKYKNC